MPTAYPSSVDNFTDPTPTSPMNSPSHAGEHSNANDAIEAVETHLGTTAAPNFLPIGGATMSGPIAMASNKVTGLANGSASSDAAAFGQIPPLTGGQLNNTNLLSTTNQAVEIAAFNAFAGHTYMLWGYASAFDYSNSGAPLGLYWSTTAASTTGAIGAEGLALAGTIAGDTEAIVLSAFAYVAPGSDTTYYLNGQSGSGNAVGWGNHTQGFSGLDECGYVWIQIS